MKLVSSAKLRKAQNAIEAMRPYEEQLLGILASLQGGTAGVSSLNLAQNKDERKTIVAIASNSSLCGGFNANAIAKVRAIRRPGDTVYAMALSEHPSYGPAAALVEKLVADVEAGRTGAVVLVYNHFVSTARQEPVVEVLMQRETPNQVGGDRGVEEESLSGTFARTGSRSDVEERNSSPAPFYIAPLLEPSRAVLLEALVPKTRKLKLYAALLDSAAAEHAARTVAMQTATDNAENLLSELTLQYNKGRQQKITSEILDLAGGQAEN